MYVVQQGQVEVVDENTGEAVRLAVLNTGEIFSEMALFEREPRAATVRAMSDAQVLTIDKRTLLRRIKEDPFIALNLMETLCRRTRKLDIDLAKLKSKVGQS